MARRNTAASRSLDDAKDLRRCIRDLIALSTLPAVWSGLSSAAIAESLAEVLLEALRLDLVYIRLRARPGEAPLEVARAQRGQDTTALAVVVRQTFGTWEDVELPSTQISSPSPFGHGAVQCVPTQLGYGDAGNYLIACSQRAGFPSETDRLLLRVGANQAAVLMQRAQAEADRVQLAAIVESTEDAILGKTLDGVITSWNPAAERLYGYSAAEMVGRSLAVLIPPERSEELLAIMERLRRGERIESFETIRVRKDGQRLDVALSVSPIRDASGAIVGASTIARDITARKRSEEIQRFLARASQVLAASLDYEATLRQIAELMVPILGDGCLVEIWQDEALVPVAAAHIDPEKSELMLETRRKYPPHLNPDHPAHGLRAGTESVLRAEITDADLRTAVSDEEQLRLYRAIGLRSCLIVPLIARGQTLGILSCYITDSDRRYGAADLALAEELAGRYGLAIDNARLYQEAQAAVRARDEFLSVASHELKTPIAAMRGVTQLLLRARARRQLDDERLSRYLEMLQKSSDHLGALTNDLLDVSRLRLGKLPLNAVSMDLSALLRAVDSRYQEHFEGLHSTVLEVPESLWLRADPDRIEQVVNNLIENAWKYSPAGGEICVCLESSSDGDADGVILRIQDQGIGLTAGSAERIFEPFGRAPNALDQHLPGLGLGLHICRQIVTQHGGRIWADSAGEGQGTTMHVWLPLAGPPAAGERPDA